MSEWSQTFRCTMRQAGTGEDLPVGFQAVVEASREVCEVCMRRHELATMFSMHCRMAACCSNDSLNTQLLHVSACRLCLNNRPCLGEHMCFQHLC